MSCVDKATTFGLRNWPAVFFGSFDPELDRFLRVLQRFFVRRPMSHASGQFGDVGEEGAIFVAPEDDDLVPVSHDQSLLQTILQNDCPNLPHLVLFGLRSLPLEVDHLFDAGAPEDVVAATRTLTEAQTDEEVTEVFETDVRVAGAAEYLFERFLVTRHDNWSLPRDHRVPAPRSPAGLLWWFSSYFFIRISNFSS